ncbi:SRPBCC family protein [Luteibacter aegosomatissinici]|uniref:SRPBCC family protein n=1 Tax=Luteibacter aegosomatissinici TaxID=2911539 RepID=UPI001FFA11D5|nr:SRPBCC family protein [Luteibacter aegosomatissinici]UPG92738.1 SRPBCC family protein [Luteibacter aegosomatissinici]
MAMFPQFVTIVARQPIDASAPQAWARIGDFADAGRFLGTTSRVVEGDGNLGSIRTVGDAVVEVMVGQTRTSYTYAQLEGPMALRSYHGCLSVEATGPAQCLLTWALTYDQTQASDAQRGEEFERLTRRFEGGALAMKAHAETP